MSAVSWSAIETALVAWVKAAGGLADGRVLLADQNGIRPGQSPPSEGAFATVRLDAPRTIGVPAIVDNFDAGRGAGQEIEEQAQSLKEFSVSVQVFAGTAIGDVSAVALASAIQSGMSLPSIRAALNAAGLGVANDGAIKNLAKVIGTAWEGRAVLDVGFRVLDAPSEKTGYIEVVDVVDETRGVTFEISADSAQPEDVPMPRNLGAPALITLGPAAGVGATLDAQSAFNNGGWLTFTAGTGVPISDVLFNLAFSSPMTEFHPTGFVNGNPAASERDLAEQLHVDVVGGATMPVLLLAEGPPLVPGTQYKLHYGVAAQ